MLARTPAYRLTENQILPGTIMRTASALAALFVGFGATLIAQPPAARNIWAVADAPAELQEPLARADLIVASMQNALLRELTQALAQGGPAHAVKACHIDVAGLTARIGREAGVRAGRTSDRLRNRANAPPAWTAALVERYAGKQTGDVDGFIVDLGTAIGVLRPIAQRPLCASCHGPAERLDPAVRATIAERYPADRAIGFEPGEIRGWFWVEVPEPQP
jgi:hypothetical protein